MAKNFSSLAGLIEADPKEMALQAQLDAYDTNVADMLDNNGW